MSSNDIGDKDFADLLSLCHEIASDYPDSLVFIGGVAVYLHAINHEPTRALAESTHDADFYISLADMADLRDSEELTANRRLSKHQLVKRGFEFDIYTERHSTLIVPYDQAIAHAVSYDRLKVMSIAHLIVLKLDAYGDRFASTKGQKDAKDLIRLALISQAQPSLFDAKVCADYLSDEHIKLLDRINKGAEFISLARGNAKQAKHLRKQFANLANEIVDAAK